MGFNVSVQGVKEFDANEYDEDCSIFIERNYYIFTTSLHMYNDNSVLIKSGEYFGLDLKPLGFHLYLDSEFSSKGEEEEYLNTMKINIDNILPILKELRDSIKSEPQYLLNVKYSSKENIHQSTFFEKYTSSERIIIDLTNVIESIECYKVKGEVEIYFITS